MKTLDALDKYLRGHKISKSTEYHTKRAFQFLNEFEQELPMSRALLNEWVVWLQKTHPTLSDISIFDYTRYIRIVYNYLADVYEWDKNPAKGSMKVDVKHRERRYFTPDEVMTILKSCKTDFQRILIGVLADSGCRVHELSGLTIDRVLDHGWKCPKETKTGEHFYRCKPEITSAMRRISVNNYVFTNTKGEPLNAGALTDRVRYIIVELAGLKGSKLGAHTFRHTAASLVAEESGSVLAVQSVTGHADIKMAQRYIHDVNNKIAQKYSPLEIAMSKSSIDVSESAQTALVVLSGNKPEQKPLKEIVINPDGTFISSVNNWIEDMFAIPPENKVIRPRLNNSDLNLLRHALQLVVEHSRWLSADVQARDLWKRILRFASNKKERDLNPAP
jgi:integrase